MSKVTLFSQACKGVEDCGICKFVCPKSLFIDSENMNEAGYIPVEMIDPDQCTACGNCMVFCPDFAIVVEAEREQGEVND